MLFHLCAITAYGHPTFTVGTQLPCAVCNADPEVVDFTVPTTPDCHECNGSGFWWMASVGGWRIRPYWTASLNDLLLETDAATLTPVTLAVPDAPDDLEESFSIDTRDTSHALLQALGLGGPAQPSVPTRRI